MAHGDAMTMEDFRATAMTAERETPTSGHRGSTTT